MSRDGRVENTNADAAEARQDDNNNRKTMMSEDRKALAARAAESKERERQAELADIRNQKAYEGARSGFKDRHMYLNAETVELRYFPSKFIVRNAGFAYLLAAVISWPVTILLQAFLKLGLIGSLDTYIMLQACLPYLITLVISTAVAYGYKRLWLTGISKCHPALLLIAPAIIFSAYPAILLLAQLGETLFPAAAQAITPEGETLWQALGFWKCLLALAIAPAIAEEILCRGLIFGAFRQRNFLTALLMSSLCFALLHGNLTQMLYTFGLGILLAIVRELADSALPCVLMHFLFNGFSVVLIFFGTGDAPGNETISEQGSGAAVSAWLLIAAILGLAMCAILLKIIKKLGRYQNERLWETDDEKCPALTGAYIVAWLLGVAVNIIFS